MISNMARSKKTKEDKEQYFTDAELQAMTPAQKLKRVSDLETEIKSQKQRLKDESGAVRDLIKEMEAKKEALLESVE